MIDTGSVCPRSGPYCLVDALPQQGAEGRSDDDAREAFTDRILYRPYQDVHDGKGDAGVAARVCGLVASVQGSIDCQF